MWLAMLFGNLHIINIWLPSVLKKDAAKYLNQSWMIRGAVFVGHSTTGRISLSSKFLRNLGSMLKTSSHVLSTSRKHKTGFLVKSFKEFSVSAVLTTACCWPSSHCIPAQKLVSVLGELNHDRSPLVLNSDKDVLSLLLFIVYISGPQPFRWREPNADLRFCWRASLKFFNTIQLTRFVLHQNEVCYTK